MLVGGEHRFVILTYLAHSARTPRVHCATTIEIALVKGGEPTVLNGGAGEIAEFVVQDFVATRRRLQAHNSRRWRGSGRAAEDVPRQHPITVEIEGICAG